MKVRVFCLFLALVFLQTVFLLPAAFANNLSIQNIQMGNRDIKNKTLLLTFDISWENSWRNKINHDAVWLTVRLNESGSSEKRLCRMSSAGINPTEFSSGSNGDVEFLVPADKIGTYIRRKSNSSVGEVSTSTAQIAVDYSSCGFDENSQIVANIFGIEMVYVPEGSFYAGDFAHATASFRQGSSDSTPWKIESENSITVSDVSSGGYYYSSASNPGEYVTGSAFTIPAGFPKGYHSFYAMKYEINEGQWVEFINSLPVAARTQHDLTDTTHKNSDAVINRNTITCSGAALACSTQRSARPVTYLSWKDLCAFLDWAGLRPMSELEFEKLSRGPYVPLAGEFSWGTADIVSAGLVSGVTEENAAETVVTPDANARFGNVSLSGGDAGSGVDYQLGPLRNGIFATSTSGRVQSGAGSFAAMELSGNVSEQVVTVGNASGVAFTGQNGDGYLSASPGFEGNANVDGWPGMDLDVSKGVTGSAGSGSRGGSWADPSERLQVSDRALAAAAVADAGPAVGGRGVRTVE